MNTIRRPSRGQALAGRSRSAAPVMATLLRPQQQSSNGASSSPLSQFSLAMPSTSSSASVSLQQLQGKDVEEYAMWKSIKQHQMGKGHSMPAQLKWKGATLDAAYERCGQVTSEYAKTFYMGTQLMTPEQAKAIWAVYVWCRRTDELVDGPNASKITPKVGASGNQFLCRDWHLV